jgi:NADH-quinone oxidoreductase subunit N
MGPVALSLAPFLIVAFGAMLLMLAEAFSKPRGGVALGAAIVCFAGCAAAAGLWLYGVDRLEGSAALQPWLVIDKFTVFFEFLLCLGGGLAALLAGGYLPEHNLDRGEFYSLILFSTFGAMVLAAAGDVLTLFLGLETMSLGVYALTAFRRGSPRSTEAAVKYFLLGSFAAALLLYGFALIYGGTSHTDFIGISQSIAGGTAKMSLVIVGFVLVLGGIVFKVSGVPFHMWTPDAYEGAPTPASAFMAVVVKGAAFAMALRVLLTSFGDARSMSWSSGWPPVLAWVAVLTMTVANLIAGRQESVKRMLAYSSIAHAGYLLVGVVATMRSGDQAGGSVLFYLLTYTVSTAGAFGALILCGKRGTEAVSFEDLASIGRRHPAAALPFALFLLSLAGVPPTAGFFGKWFIFKAAMAGGFSWLTVIGFLNSVLGAYYYLRVLVFMYMREPAAGAPIATPMKSGYVNAALVLSAMFVIWLGIAPGSSVDIAVEAARMFGTKAI